MSLFIVLPILTLLMFELGLTLQPADFKLHPTPPTSGVLAGLLRMRSWKLVRRLRS